MAQAINMGSTIEILNLAINDATDTELVFVDKRANNILIRRRGAGALQIRLTDGATEYFTVPDNQSITIELGARKESICWIRTDGGADVAEVLVMYEGV